MNNIIIKTKAANKHSQKGQTLIQMKKKLKQTRLHVPIYIYDITFRPQKPDKTIIYINDHVNKTGLNILRKQKNNQETNFYDLTRLYKQHKQGITTNCLGKNYESEKNNQENPSTTICNIAVYLKAQGFKNIYGRLINAF